MIGKSGKLKMIDGSVRSGTISGVELDFYIFITDVGSQTIYINKQHIIEFVPLIDTPAEPKIGESVHGRWQSVFKQQSS